MSRAPPFPTSNRSGQRTNGSPYDAAQQLPLNRPPYPSNAPNPRPGGSTNDYPARPMRSDLRQREPADNYGAPQALRPGPPPEARRINRDSVGTTFSEPPARRQARVQVDLPPPPRRTTEDGDTGLSPGGGKAFDAVMRTFQGAAAAGNKRRATENSGVGDFDYEREEAEKRRREHERADRERRDRMRAREAQQQQRGNRRKGAGDIDGESDGPV